MLTEERYEEILKIIDNAGAASVQELVNCLNISESTVRRDLLALHKQGKLRKVHGGATSLGVSPYEADMEDLQDKYSLHMAEKRKIAKYAAGLVKKNDFVFIDAGSTTEQMADFLVRSEATFVTNSIPLVQKLARKGIQVFVLPGRVKGRTESIVGGPAQEMMRNFHFTIGFFGANGISVRSGCTTPDTEEASGKMTAIGQCAQTYVLADSSKFGLASHITFASLERVRIITARSETAIDYEPYEKLTEVHIL